MLELVAAWEATTLAFHKVSPRSNWTKSSPSMLVSRRPETSRALPDLVAAVSTVAEDLVSL
jgi:hypothetical protein